MKSYMLFVHSTQSNMYKAVRLKRFLPVYICVLYFIIPTRQLHAQDTLQMKKESSYYHTYFQNLIGRVYTGRKYTSLNMRANDHTNNFKYKPNTYNGLGIGVTYRALTLNLGYGFGFLLNSKEKGKTSALDLQIRFYASKWAIDCYAKNYSGYYLSPKGVGNPEDLKSPSYYVRPDLKLRLFGASAYRMFNGKGFSLRPAFVQDVKQKASGGSFLLGGEWFYINVRSDSSLVPSRYAVSPQKVFTRTNMLQVGPGGGYAYTQVLPHNFFATAYLTANVNISLLREAKADGSVFRTGLNTNLLYRVAFGYDNGNYNICAYMVNNKIDYKGSTYNYIVNTGNVRIVFAKRFKTTRKINKYMQYFNILID